MYYVILADSEFMICEECGASARDPQRYSLRNITAEFFAGKEKMHLRNYNPPVSLVRNIFTNAQDAVEYVGTQYILDFDEKYYVKDNQKFILQKLI